MYISHFSAEKKNKKNKKRKYEKRYYLNFVQTVSFLFYLFQMLYKEWNNKELHICYFQYQDRN